jgi:2OG-Fe(II) oxygenase superfamily
MANSLGLFASFDLEDTGLLPAGWREDVVRVASTRVRSAELKGGAPASLEPIGTLIRYGLVDGEVVGEELPWLARLYADLADDLASRVAGRSILTSDKVVNGVNINVLQGVGGRYESHLDTNPLTGLIFVTTHAEEEGGQLEFDVTPSPLVFPPRAGMLLLFDATRAPHRVTPLRKDVTRISIPMNFYTKETIAQHSPDLDFYLYGGREPKQATV